MSPRARRVGGLTALAVAVLVAASLVWQSAYAGFGDSTTPRTLPTVTTGTVALTDDDTGRAMFAVTGLRPGDSGEKCITVTSTGNRAATVRLYATGRDSTRGLADALVLTVDAGTRKQANGCALNTRVRVWSGSVSAMPGGYADGLDGWATDGVPTGESRTYVIDYSLPASTPDSAQGGTAKLTFVWEAQPR